MMQRCTRLPVTVLALLGLCLMTGGQGFAQPVEHSGYRQPAEPIVQLLTATAPPKPLVHARSGRVALLYEEPLISMRRLLAPRLALAGLRIDPVTRITGLDRMIERIRIIDVRQPDDAPAVFWTPDSPAARFAYVEFSPDGHRLSALRVESGAHSELWLYDIPTGEARMLSNRVNAAWGKPCSWLDGMNLLCRTVMDTPLPLHSGPGMVSVSHSGGKVPTRTYSFLLESDADDALFEACFQSRLMRIGTDGSVATVGINSGIIPNISVAPDGNHVLLRRLQAPYPRLVPARQFPASIEVWDIAEQKQLYRSPLTGFGYTDVDDNGIELDSIQWRSQLPVTAGFLQRQNHEDGSTEYLWRTLETPFDGNPEILARSDKPIVSFGWTSAGTPWFSQREDTGDTTVTLLLPGKFTTFWRGKRSNRYNQPGQPLRLDGPQSPVLEYNGNIYLAGQGLNDAGARPFLDSFSIETGQTTRLYQSTEGVYEPVIALLDPGLGEFLTARETETTPLQLNRITTDGRTTIFQSDNPYPALEQVTRRLIHYQRADGVPLHATVYLPANHEPGRPLPTLVWIYPREYDDPEHATQLDSKPFQFHRIRAASPLAAVLAGYAVVINPSMPIITNADDNAYLPQLVSSAEALADYLVEQGISERSKIAVGGQSYGAFSAANLLIHSDRFASGIALSGAYNRTLTPFGFQHETRTFWDATDYYASISPFFHVNQLKKPLLIVHGKEDPNPGTPVIQARRFFHALVGEGTKSRYVELPGEEHHYRGRESVLHASSEMIDWLDSTIGPVKPTKAW